MIRITDVLRSELKDIKVVDFPVSDVQLNVIIIPL